MPTNGATIGTIRKSTQHSPIHLLWTLEARVEEPQRLFAGEALKHLPKEYDLQFAGIANRQLDYPRWAFEYSQNCRVVKCVKAATFSVIGGNTWRFERWSSMTNVWFLGAMLLTLGKHVIFDPKPCLLRVASMARYIGLAIPTPPAARS